MLTCDYKMKTRELIVVVVILGYFLIVFSAIMIDREDVRLSSKHTPMQMVEIYGNGTVRNYEMENTIEPSFLTSIVGTVGQLVFALPFVLGGIGMWGMPLAILNNSSHILSESINQWLLYLIPSLISIPAILVLSTNIPKWRRISYAYVFAMIILGTPILLSSTFGQ